MCGLRTKNGKVFTSKSVGTGPSSCEKKNLPGRGLTEVEKQCCRDIWLGAGPVSALWEREKSLAVSTRAGEGG